MPNRTVAVARRAVEAAIVASIPQVIVPKIEERLFLPKHETADLGPRFVQALADRASTNLPEDTKWLAASAFHFGYAAAWGLAYGAARERWRFSPWAGGLAMAAVIHLITFPRWGGAVLVGAEPPPERRSWRYEIVLASAPLIFGLATALLYGSGPGECEDR